MGYLESLEEDIDELKSLVGGSKALIIIDDDGKKAISQNFIYLEGKIKNINEKLIHLEDIYNNIVYCVLKDEALESFESTLYAKAMHDAGEQLLNIFEKAYKELTHTPGEPNAELVLQLFKNSYESISKQIVNVDEVSDER